MNVVETMRRAAVALVKRVYFHARLYMLVGKLTALGRARRITILYHHRLLTTDFFRRHPTQLCFHEQHPEEDFEAKVAFLSHHYPVVRLAEAVERLAGPAPLREDAFVIAFDDGFEDNYDRLFPVMQRLRVPFTLFVTSESIGTTESPWFQEIINHCEFARLPAIQFAGKRFPLSTPAERAAAVKGLWREVRHAPFSDIQTLLTAVREQAGADAGLPSEDSRMLRWEQLREMAESGVVDIENHTARHPYLARENREDVKREVLDCERVIETNLGRKTRFFSYPSGKPEVDFTDETVAVVRGLGYRGAVTTELGVNHVGADLFRLKRDQSIRRDFYTFVWMVTGGPELVPTLRRLVSRWLAVRVPADERQAARALSG
jgi:peptidoglycan/xylan/chitin deacetylase (PgdA/CDA1 family)